MEAMAVLVALVVQTPVEQPLVEQALLVKEPLEAETAGRPEAPIREEAAVVPRPLHRMRLLVWEELAALAKPRP